MKKSLVLAMAMALGVTASAYAANPFSDVPAGHWAYDSVNKLAAAGVIDGYGDGSFGGDKLMTRYEMAQIVARAMANGANVDKLAAEFADELDALGVRVAALEKKADNVKITGQIRAHYLSVGGDLTGADKASKLRSRIWINGTINDNWTYKGMLQNEQSFINDTGDETTDFQRAYLEGRVGGVAVSAGRQELVLGDGNIYDTRFDGVILGYGKDVKVSGYYGKPTNLNKAAGTENKTIKDGDGEEVTVTVPKAAVTNYDQVIGASLAAKLGVVNASVAYDKFSGDVKEDDEIFSVQAGLDLAKNLNFNALYMKADEDGNGDDDGYVLTLAYGAAKAAKVGSYGLVAKYYDQPATTVLAHTMNGINNKGTGFKGYSVAGYYTLAKNIVAGVEYYDLESKDDTEIDMKTLWSQLIFTF